uniref:Cell surface protein n=1 Tax=Acetithermum autotrophicum TaxID=1446466 RepID=H5SSR4_ACEAU|nr:cell surface protein [Candidatus Acetothermum autotrophicum]
MTIRAVRLCVVLVVVIAVGSIGWAQSASVRAKLQTTLLHLLAETGATAGKMSGRSVNTVDIHDGSIQVVLELQTSAELGALSEALKRLGGSMELSYSGVMQARVPVAQLEAVAALPQVRFVRLPVAPLSEQGTVVSEGVSLMGSRAWNSAGLDGKGIRVGVLDAGFFRFEALLGRELPPRERVVTRSFRRDNQMYSSGSPSRHGTALAEIVHDVAPGATLYLTAFATDVELRRAMDYLITERVDVISTSFSTPSGCFTGPGIFEPYLRRAREAGIFWSTSGGNDGDQHWEGRWRDDENDRLHNFQGSDNLNDLDVELFEFEYPSGERVATFVISGVFSWEADCQNAGDDYEIVFFDEQGRELPPFDEDTGQGQVNEWLWRPGVPIKQFFATLDYPVSQAGTSKRVRIGVRQLRSGAPRGGLDIVWRCCDIQRFEYSDPRGSVSIFEPRSSANVFTVGAFAHNPQRCPSWAPCPNGLFDYSSRGPTKDGRVKPDITAPSHVSTASYGRFTGASDGQGFTGTSAAQPHVAGAAALIKQAFPNYGPAEIARLLESRAEDRGAPGRDNDWGAGQLVLGAAPGQNRPPVADAGPDQTVTVGATVQLDGSRSNDPDGDKLSYSWRFVSLPTGSRAQLSDPALVNPTFVADVRGEYLIELTVDDGKGARTSDQVKVTATLPAVLLSLAVAQVVFVTPGWQRELRAGCVVYTNVAEAQVQLVLEAGGMQEHTVAAGREVLVCGDLVHLESVGEPRVLEGVAAGASPLALKFVKLEFGEPARWERSLREGCLVYRNARAEPNALTVTLSDGSVRGFSIGSGREVLLCGGVVHIE